MFDTRFTRNPDNTRNEDLLSVTFNLHLALNALHACDEAESDFSIYQIAKDFIKDGTALMSWTGATRHEEEWVAPLKLVSFDNLEVVNKEDAKTLAKSTSEIGDSGTLYITVNIEGEEPYIFSRKDFSERITEYYQSISNQIVSEDQEDYE